MKVKGSKKKTKRRTTGGSKKDGSKKDGSKKDGSKKEGSKKKDTKCKKLLKKHGASLKRYKNGRLDLKFTKKKEKQFNELFSNDLKKGIKILNDLKKTCLN